MLDEDGERKKRGGTGDDRADPDLVAHLGVGQRIGAGSFERRSDWLGRYDGWEVDFETSTLDIDAPCQPIPA